MKKYLLIIILLTSLLIGCNSPVKTKDFDYGRVENMKYSNSYFDFEMTLPDNWVVQSKEQIKKINKIGMDVVAGDDENMKFAMNASLINTANLLSASEYEYGAPVDFNPSIDIVVENIKNYPGLKTGSDYLYQMKKLLENSHLKQDYIDKEFGKEVIGGIEFFKMNAEMNYMQQNIKQIYYSAIVNRFSFTIVIIFINDQQKSELLGSINSIKFKK
jgi:hypothetical protein